MKTAKKQNEESVSPIGFSSEKPEESNGTNELVELRRLIVQPDEVSDVLPSAITQSAKKSSHLSKATLPVVEENIRQSVIRNPDILAEALFPAIGPIIRKAISEALSQMIQSLNQTLENSVSPKGFRWRLEAWQTGKPFAEVVMLNSLVYRVEEVFLIHRRTGSLLQHVSSQSFSHDADMVSAMLTAIQDFAHDSFKESENASIDSLNFDEFSIWVERSPDAILAGVIRGNAPLSLREVFEEAIESIQFVQGEELDNFDGDTSKFEKSRPMLDNCLQFKLNTKDKERGKILTPANILGAVVGIILLAVTLSYVIDYWRWSNYVIRLKNEPGIAVTENDFGWWKNSVSGLRDSMAVNPDDLLSEYYLKKENVESYWRPYQDLSDSMILTRSYKILQPPNDVKFTLESGILTATGRVTKNWFTQAQNLSVFIAGVTELRFGREALKSKIESQNILFNCGTLDIAKGEEAKIPELIKDFESMSDMVKNFQVEVIGQTDETGSLERNTQIRKQRADKIINELSKSEKINEIGSAIKAIGVGADENAGCRVDFRIIFTEQ